MLVLQLNINIIIIIIIIQSWTWNYNINVILLRMYCIKIAEKIIIEVNVLIISFVYTFKSNFLYSCCKVWVSYYFNGISSFSAFSAN